MKSIPLEARLIAAAIYFIAAPFIGGLLSGVDRVISARMQGRKGPSIFQGFYDIVKLFSKQRNCVNKIQVMYLGSFLFFIIFTGALFFAGCDLLMIFFSLTTANIFLAVAAASTNSPYATMGAQRELLQMLAYEPMTLLTAVGFYVATGTFKSAEMLTQIDLPAIVSLPGVFVGFLFILVIKLRKHPYDLSTSHHAHQEVVKGISTEFSGPVYALMELSHWYENVFLMGIVSMFFINNNPWSILWSIAASVIVYLVMILVDNTNARMKWDNMLKNTWIATMVLGALNIFILHIFK